MRFSACYVNSKKNLFLFFLVFCLLRAFGQQDSLAVVHADWKIEQIAPGIRLKQFSFTDSSLFNSNQYISILEIKPKRKTVFGLGFEPKEKKTTSRFGRENNAVAAVNGTFFDVANGGSVDFIRADGKVINENRLLKDGSRARHQKAAVVIKNGRFDIAQWDGTPDWEKRLDGENIMLSGPLLMFDGHPVKLDSSGFDTARHPRTAAAVGKNKQVLLITVDGRNSNAAGMSLFELRQVLKWLQADAGLNLDGGGSTTMWVNGKGVVNHPSDNKKWDHEGERKVANVILVKRK